MRKRPSRRIRRLRKLKVFRRLRIAATKGHTLESFKALHMIRCVALDADGNEESKYYRLRSSS